MSRVCLEIKGSRLKHAQERGAERESMEQERRSDALNWREA